MTPLAHSWAATGLFGLAPRTGYLVAGVILVGGVVLGLLVGHRSGRRSIAARLTAVGSRLGTEPPEDRPTVEGALGYLEQVTGSAAEAVAEASADAIRLKRSLDTMPQGVLICDESGSVVFRNVRANGLMASRHGDALAAQAVTEMLEIGWNNGSAERTLDLYGPPRRTLLIRARLIDDGRKPLGVIAVIDDVSERRRLDEIRRDFVANVSHELKTPMGALGLLAETLMDETDADVAQRMAGRIHTEAFRVSRIIDDLLDLSRIESEESPPRDPVMVNLVMAEAVERVRSAAEARDISIELDEPDPPISVLGDRRQLVSAMHALLENAVTYSYPGSAVSVVGSLVKEEPEVSGSGPRLDHRPAGHPPQGSPGRDGPGDHDGPPVAPDHRLTGPDPRLSEAPDSRSLSTLPGMSAGPGRSTGAPGEGPGGAGGEDPGPLDAPRERVHISVIDHGVGIPTRDLERIFERFYRVDLGRSRGTGGTGLGLSIVRHVASNHMGRVDVESREGEGSTFTLVLPVHTESSS